ncbi:MAG: FAD-dependent oxidoreductase [Eubacteriales bacterium]|nr:FAD-dependent oxidoreductase [Eubacteriales bacterium]
MNNSMYDVVVVGGGLAGVAAAIAAAREGLSALIVEKYGFLGGMAVSGLVNPFMPYWQFDEQRRKLHDKPVNAGLFKLITDRLAQMGAFDTVGKMTFHEEYLKLVLDRLCREYGVKVLFHSQMTGVGRDGNRIERIAVSNKAGTRDYKAKVFVDASGDADLTAFAGFETKLGRDEDGLCQPMTLCFRVANVNCAKWDRKKAIALYQAMQKQGLIQNKREDILTFPTMIDNVVHFNSTRINGKNPVDPEDLTEAEMEAREQVHELFTFMKQHVPGFEHSALLISAAQTGVRESRRIVGESTVTEKDLLGCRKFPDSIARGTYDIDIHNPSGSGTVIMHIPANDYYTIPLSAALPLGSDNLVVAGRPLSSTHEAHSAFRVMPITTCIGEGAGCAISLALRENIPLKRVDCADLHKLMDQYGALY